MLNPRVKAVKPKPKKVKPKPKVTDKKPVKKDTKKAARKPKKKSLKLSSLEGIDAKSIKKLNEAGVDTIRDSAEENPSDLAAD